MIKILPDIPKIRAHWAHRCSEIPEWLEVPMADGRVINYYPQITQPAPVLRKSLDSFSEICVGYEKPADAGTSNRQKKGLRGKYTTEGGKSEYR